MPTTDALDREIRSLITEVMESAPPAPSLELESRDPGQTHLRSRRAPWSSHRPRLLVLTGGFGAVATAALLLVLFLPSVGPKIAVAEAAQLRQIAINASSQPALRLKKNQWLLSEEKVSFSLQVSQVGSTPTPSAMATVGASVKVWSNNLGQTCTSTTAGRARFASSVNQKAWKTAGFLEIPKEQPQPSCTTGGGIGITGGSSVINVSTLPTDPSTLARELTNGTTGIAALDQLHGSESQSVAFERAEILLVGPRTGATPAFRAALYNALALIPGIEKLGDVTTHTGAMGLGFAADTAGGRSAIVVNPMTGALLEVRNIPDENALMGWEIGYLAPGTSSIGRAGGGYSITIEWLDPTSALSIVGSDSLPAGIKPPQIDQVTGSMLATAKPGLSISQLTVLESRLRKRFDSKHSSVGFAPTPPATNAGAKVIIDVVGARSQVTEVATAVRASGLFSSVVVAH